MGRRTPFSELSDKDKSFIVNYCATNEDSDLKFEKYSSLTRVNDNRVFSIGKTNSLKPSTRKSKNKKSTRKTTNEKTDDVTQDKYTPEEMTKILNAYDVQEAKVDKHFEDLFKRAEKEFNARIAKIDKIKDQSPETIQRIKLEEKYIYILIVQKLTDELRLIKEEMISLLPKETSADKLKRLLGFTDSSITKGDICLFINDFALLESADNIFSQEYKETLNKLDLERQKNAELQIALTALQAVQIRSSQLKTEEYITVKQYEKIKKTLEGMHERYANLQVLYTNLIKEHKIILGNNRELKGQLKTLEHQANILTGGLASISKILQIDKKYTGKTLMEAIGDLKADNNQLRQQLEANELLRRTELEADQTMPIIQARIDERDREIEALNIRIKELTGKLAEKNTDQLLNVTEKNNEISQLRQRITELESDKTQLLQDLSDASEQNARQHFEIIETNKELRYRLDEANDYIEILRERGDEGLSKAERDAYEKRISDLSIEILSIEKLHKEKLNRIERGEDFETRIRDNLERLKIENQQLRSDLQVKTKKENRMREDLARITSERAELKKKVKILESENKEYEKKIKAYIKEIESLEAKLTKAVKDLKDYKNKNGLGNSDSAELIRKLNEERDRLETDRLIREREELGKKHEKQMEELKSKYDKAMANAVKEAIRKHKAVTGDTVKGSSDRLRKEITDRLEKQYKQKESEMESRFKSQIDALNRTIKDIETENKIFKEKVLNERSKIISDYESQMSGAIEKFKQEKDKIERDAQARIDAKTSQYEEQIADLKREFEGRMGETNKFDDRRQRRDKKLEELDFLKKDYEERKKLLEIESRERIRDIQERSKQEIEAIKKSLKTTTSEAETLQNMKIKELEDKIVEETTGKDKVIKQLRDRENEIKELMDQITLLKQNVAKEVSNQKTNTDKIKAPLVKGCKEEINRLDAKLIELNDTLDHIRSIKTKIVELKTEGKIKHKDTSDRIDDSYLASDILDLERIIDEYRRRRDSLVKSNTKDCNSYKDVLDELVGLEFKLKDLDSTVNYDYEDAKGIGRVYIRCKNRSKGGVYAIKQSGYNVQLNHALCSTKGNNVFGQFTGVFDHDMTTEQIYKSEFKDLVKKSFDPVKGFDITIFAYGQSGAGKTYTLIGDPNKGVPGLIDYVLTDIINDRPSRIDLSAVQIYRGNLYNSLHSYKQKVQNVITNDNTTEFSYIQESRIDSDTKPFNKPLQSEELQKLISPTYREIQDINAYKRNLQIITDLRPTRATQMNPESSRSHLFMTFRIVFGNTMRKITFVDLAGNEKFWGKTNERTTSYFEGQYIVQTLSMLKEYLKNYANGIKIVPDPSANAKNTMYNMLQYLINSNVNSDALNKIALVLAIHTVVPDGKSEIDKEKKKLICDTTPNTLNFGLEILAEKQNTLAPDVSSRVSRPSEINSRPSGDSSLTFGVKTELKDSSRAVPPPPAPAPPVPGRPGRKRGSPTKTVSFGGPSALDKQRRRRSSSPSFGGATALDKQRRKKSSSPSLGSGLTGFANKRGQPPPPPAPPSGKKGSPASTVSFSGATALNDLGSSPSLGSGLTGFANKRKPPPVPAPPGNNSPPKAPPPPTPRKKDS